VSTVDYGPSAQRLAFECGTDGPRVIVVGMDGSPTSVNACAYACGLARRQRSQLVVVFVVQTPLFVAIVGEVAAAVAQTQLELGDDLRDEIRRAAEEFAVPTRFVTRRGDPFVELRDAANAAKADLVVVGVSTRAGHRFLGSVAHRLVRLGRWPVVVVP
jgi:nucleotide-binding universal stress UspA family protein